MPIKWHAQHAQPNRHKWHVQHQSGSLWQAADVDALALHYVVKLELTTCKEQQLKLEYDEDHLKLQHTKEDQVKQVI